MFSVTGSYVGFGLFVYFTYGKEVADDPIITQVITSPNDVFMMVVKVLFCLNMFFSYPLIIFPANMVIESYLYAGWEKTRKRQMMKNLNRSILVLFTIVVSIAMAKQLDKFLAILGAIGCTPIAFTLPTLFHYKLLAKTKREKYIDISVIVFSLIIMVFCTAFGVYSWIEAE